MITRRQMLVAVSVLGLLSSARHAQAETVIRVATLKSGTVAWELDTIIHHGLDTRYGIKLEVIPVAGKQSADVMLAGGEADVIVTDWLWVSRQRHLGADYTFIPYSRQVGSVLVPPESPLKTLMDLKGKRIGVAGGPTDKSWILLCALAKKEMNIDLKRESEPVFGAPPLLNELFLKNKIDALLTYWNFAARLKSSGARDLLSIGTIAQSLGLDSDTPLLGYVFSQSWSKAHDDAAQKLAAASADAKQRLAHDDDEWLRLRPLMNANDDQEFEVLKAGFRAGIPSPNAIDRAAALRLFNIVTEFGEDNLMSDNLTLAPGIFAND